MRENDGSPRLQDEGPQNALTGVNNSLTTAHIEDEHLFHDGDFGADGELIEPAPYQEYEFDPNYGSWGTPRGTLPEERPEEREERAEAFPHANTEERAEEATGTPMGNVSLPTYKGETFPGAQHGFRFETSENFLFTAEDTAKPLWGDIDLPLWQSGESLMLVGPPGVGKSTLAQHILIGQLIGGSVLGHPVEKTEGMILYLAMDRPRQIARGMRRLIVDAGLRQIFKERVIFHAGPLPFMLTADRTRVARMCKYFGVTTIVIDSIKDIIAKPSNEDDANAYNSARQKALADGIEWIELHHNRKAQGENKEPKTLDDVYGNRFITAGAGSVFSLWGQPGDTVVNFTHIRQPGEGMFPSKILLDKATGSMEIQATITLDALVKRLQGVSAREAATALHGPKPTESNIRSCRSKLKRLCENGVAFEDNNGPEVRFRSIGTV